MSISKYLLNSPDEQQTQGRKDSSVFEISIQKVHSKSAFLLEIMFNLNFLDFSLILHDSGKIIHFMMEEYYKLFQFESSSSFTILD